MNALTPTVAEAAFAAMGADLPHGLPHRRHEQWHYADWRTLLDRPYGRAGAPRGGCAASPWGDISGYGLVIDNGQITAQTFPDGVTLSADEQALSPDHAALAVNATLAQPLHLHVPDGLVLDAPLHLSFALTDPMAASGVQLRVTLGAGAQVTVLEHLTASPDASGYHSAVVIYEIGAGAVLTRGHADSLPDGLAAFFRADVRLCGAGAQMDSTSLLRGARALRHECRVQHLAQHGQVRLCGAMVLAGQRHANLWVDVAHTVGPGETEEQFRTTVDDAAHAAFQGMIRIAPGANGVAARQSHHALVLGDRARVDAKPELEIFADDVQCAHGATCGALDADALFYIRARGVPEALARDLLASAFVRAAFDAAPAGVAAPLLALCGGDHDL